MLLEATISEPCKSAIPVSIRCSISTILNPSSIQWIGYRTNPEDPTMAYSRYYLCDLQVHTPSDPQHNYGHWSGSVPDSDFAEKLAAKCKESGVDVIAATDHNRVDWYPCLKQVMGAEGITVFPGVEVSVNRYHLLVLWESDEEGYRLAEQFLSSCWDPGKSPFDNGGDPIPVGIGQVADVAERAIDHKGLVFAPHSTLKGLGFFARGVCTKGLLGNN